MTKYQLASRQILSASKDQNKDNCTCSVYRFNLKCLITEMQQLVTLIEYEKYVC